MSNKTPKRRSQTANMENGEHETVSETNGTTTENEELKGFTEIDVNTAKGVIKDVSVVLTHTTPVQELEQEEDDREKRVTRSQKKESEINEPIVVEEETEKRKTRSQTKENSEDVVETPQEIVETLETPQETIETKQNGEHSVDSETKEVSDVAEELEPDETEPELQFDENSDRDSGKNSPASRCLTRRSHVRNVPTPKTPKLLAEIDTPPTPIPEEGDDEDLSTQAVAGNDTTRANFTVNEEEQQPSEFFKSLKDKSLSETLRGISSRRTIHSRHEQHLSRTEFHLPYPKRASVESISGMKRKGRSPSPEDNKRIKRDSMGLLSYIRSPVFGVRHHFSKDLPSSTPKLTGFRNKNSLLDSEEISKIRLDVDDDQQEKKWCSIM